jgi:hypothetical protein
LLDADPRALERDALAAAPHMGGFRYEILLPGDEALGHGAVFATEDASREGLTRLLAAVAELVALRAAQAEA